MIRSVAARALWLAKGAALFWGAVFTLALVVGVGTTALAAVPGDPFGLGETNTIDNALTKLAGSNAGTMLVVDNNSSASGARALDLRVEAGKQPLNVNAEAGKAGNLNADEVDGLGAEQIGVNGLERVSRGSGAVDSRSAKSTTASCPDGKVLVGTGFGVTAGTTGSSPDVQTDVSVATVDADDDSVFVLAVEEEPTDIEWAVAAEAICATEGTP